MPQLAQDCRNLSADKRTTFLTEWPVLVYQTIFHRSENESFKQYLIGNSIKNAIDDIRGYSIPRRRVGEPTLSLCSRVIGVKGFWSMLAFRRCHRNNLRGSYMGRKPVIFAHNLLNIS